MSFFTFGCSAVRSSSVQLTVIPDLLSQYFLCFVGVEWNSQFLRPICHNILFTFLYAPHVINGLSCTLDAGIKIWKFIPIKILQRNVSSDWTTFKITTDYLGPVSISCLKQKHWVFLLSKTNQDTVHIYMTNYILAGNLLWFKTSFSYAYPFLFKCQNIRIINYSMFP